MRLGKKPKRKPFRWIFFLAVLGGTLLLLQGRNQPPLMVYHTEKLTEEFTADTGESMESFGDYLQLEERLFQELNQKVYNSEDNTSGSELSRYTPGSIADPRRMQPDWNRTFELASESPAGGVLLLHGMSDSPYSLRALGRALHERGYWVVGLRLPGHGTTPAGLKRLRWEDMAAAVQLAAVHLKSKVQQQPLHLVGYSTGAPLALNFTMDAMEEKTDLVPASLILVSPAIGIHPAAGLARFKDWLSRVPGLGHFAWLSLQAEFDPFKYNSFATNAAHQVHRITNAVSRRIETWAQANLPETFPPVLTFKSIVDATVSVQAVEERLLTPLNSKKHELVLFDINRSYTKSVLLAADPELSIEKLTRGRSLPFVLTFVTNESPASMWVVVKSKLPRQETISQSSSQLRWPQGILSLSHVALPFPPDDPIYGQQPPTDDATIFLGQIALKGERNLLKIPYDWLIRLRHNPFYDYLEERSIQWLERVDER